jgi:hypothetical protein
MAETRPQTWIGFYDLLGTKDSSKIRRSDFPDKLIRFGESIQDFALHFRCDAKIRFFSDCAYIEASDPAELIKFSRLLRRSLFSEEVFFKAALAPGQLGDRPQHIHSARESPYRIDVQGTIFGNDVVDVYYAQENFKGVGYWVSSAAIDHGLEHHLVNSCFPTDASRPIWTAFRDIRFDQSEIGGLISREGDNGEPLDEPIAFLESLLTAALRANTSRRHLSRYYFSVFMSVIQSSDFSRLVYDEDGWDNSPVVFSLMFESERRRKNFLSLAGAEALYLAAANRIFLDSPRGARPRFRDASFDSTCNEVVSILSSMKILNGPLGSYPSVVLSPEVREDIGRRTVQLRMSGPMAR